MKIYKSLEEINSCLNNKQHKNRYLNIKNQTENITDLKEPDNKNKFNNKTFEEIEYFDNVKTRVLKYVFYKKRTKEEVRRKFETMYNKEILNEVIDNLVELGYINDNEYINKAVNEFMVLKNMSLRELKYKLMSKGLKSKTIDDYFEKNYDILQEYEKKSAQNIAQKKLKTMEKIELKNYLIKKGYKEESIREAI